jgi:hypothetical protein
LDTSPSLLSCYSSSPALEEIKELGERRGSAEVRQRAALADKEEAEAAKKVSADRLAQAEAELTGLLR